MFVKSVNISAITFIVVGLLQFSFSFSEENDDSLFISFRVDLKNHDLKLYWKNDKEQIFGSLKNLNIWLDKQNSKLIFAMNGGMYKHDQSPQGLFIDNKKRLAPLDTANGNGNFYMKPNGVFFITDQNIPTVCSTTAFTDTGHIKYATQSGPMLLINGNIHPSFTENSKNLNIRNGVGILPDGSVLLVISKKEVNFYSFAAYFKKMGCKNALYLDGFVSRVYYPEGKWIQKDGNFGVIIGVTEHQK